MVGARKFVVIILFFLILPLNTLFTQNSSDAKLVIKFMPEVEKLATSLNRVLDFVNKYYYEINLDGALGIILTEAQLLQALKNTANKEVTSLLLMFIEKCQISKKIIELLPKEPEKNILFIHVLLNPHVWERNVNFVQGQLRDLGTYESWTVQDTLKNRTAQYGGVSSDECLSEILGENPGHWHLHFCSATFKCKNFMFGRRIDTGYILTHRLLYLYVLKMARCAVNQDMVAKTIKNYCSLILKEAKTNAFLGFPQHDIFLEQVVLCGMEGFTEFLQEDWTSSIVEWQTAEGCYTENGTYANNNSDNIITSRSANVISFGCTDHATGLGAAALALNFRYILQNLDI